MTQNSIFVLSTLLVAGARSAVLTARQLPAAAAPYQSRRDTLRLGLLGLGGFTGCLTAGAGSAAAFDNAIPEYAQYADKAKRKGSPPKDLGVAKRTINAESINADPVTFNGLRGCDGKPNCFSTTGDDLLEDRILTGVDTLIKPWLPPADDKTPFKSLVQVVKAYKPGQGNVDGGGFQVVKETDSYIYVQFEALKKGYIDDVEFAMASNSVQVRSSSRVGQTDFGVNALRLNYIAAALRKEGWTIPEITAKTHEDYFYAADDARDQTFDKDRRKIEGFEPGENGRMARPPVG